MTAVPPTLQPERFRHNRSHISALNGVRGLAVLLVLWAHLPAESTLASILRQVAQPGYLGVDIFFVLSGFLITRILLADRAEGRSLRNFIIRRSLRIFPIYYLSILIFLVIAPGLYLAWCSIYTQNFVFAFDGSSNPLRHTWSLAVEEHFYLFWPLIIHMLSFRTSRNLAFGLIVGGLLTATLLTLLNVDYLAGLLYRITPVRMISLAAGAVLAYVEPALHASPRRTLIIAACLAFCGIGGLGTHFFVPPNWTPLIKLVCFSFISTGVLLASLSADDLSLPGIKGLQTGPLPYLGKISYGIYLYHYPIYQYLGVLHGIDEDKVTLQRIVVAIGLSILVAAMSFHLLESRVLRLKHRFT